VVSHLSKTVSARVGITVFLGSVISIASVTAVVSPVAGSLRVAVADQAVFASNTLAKVALKVFRAASVAELSAKFLQLVTASVTRLRVFESVSYRKTCVFHIIKKDGKLLGSEIGTVKGVECTHLETILNLIVIFKCFFVLFVS
jgi:hypothetical protein